MRKILLIAFGTLLHFASIAQLQFQASMIPGPTNNSVDIVVKPTINFTGYLTNVVFTIQIPNGVTQPTITPLSLSTYFPTFNTLAAVPSTGYINYGFTATNAALITNTTINAVNYPVLRLTFAGGPVTPTSIRLANLPGGGPGTLYQFYTEANSSTLGVADYTNYVQMFYGAITSPVAPYPDPTTGYNNYQYMQLATVLPVRLTDFSAVRSDKDGYLNWTIQNQDVLADHFVIQRSFNGVDFMDIGTKAANASISGTVAYNYTDPNIDALKAGIVYYRVKSLDRNGEFTYTDIKSIKLNSMLIGINLYPNPAVIFTNISFDLPAASHVIITITDEAGKELLKTETEALKGLNRQRINVNRFSAGKYILTLKTDAETQSIPFVKSN